MKRVKLLAWTKRNPKLALIVLAASIAPLSLTINYVLLIIGLITAEEFTTINTSIITFLKGLIFLA